MQFLKFLIALLLAAGLTWLLYTPEPLGAKGIPSIGRVINPFTGFWKNGEAIGATDEKTYRLPDLDYPVQVLYDERLVPHIFAENMTDAMYVQGYLVAQHRLWQMDMTSRFAAGRLAEVLGEEMIQVDRLQRRRGFPTAARKLLEVWRQSEEEFEYVEAFSKGVNAYIEQLHPRDYPLEFKLIHYAPEPWSPYKSALIAKSMDQTLSMRADDIEATNALNAFGAATFDFLYPLKNPKQEPVIPPGTTWGLTDSTSWNIPESIPATYEGYLPGLEGDRPDPHWGSNNWAVSGSKTANGYPILANDPHLNTRLPAIWYEQQIKAGEHNFYGVTIPGIPGIIIGFNQDIAWGMTNVSQDVLDWYKIDWVDLQKTSYQVDGRVKQVQYRVDTINIRGKDALIDSVKLTDFGPIVYQEATDERSDLAMYWLMNQDHPHGGLQTFFTLAKGKNFDDYYQATNHFETPPQNFVFASREGDIAITVNGRFPIRPQGQGRFVMDGKTTDGLWTEYVPDSMRARVKNPPQGYVTSANQRSTDDTYPYYYHGYFDDYRGRIANRLLSRMDSITIEDMMAMQNSNFSILAEEALPLLLEKLDTTQLNAIQLGLCKLLKEWQYQFNPDLSAPILFEEWWQAFKDLLWDEIAAMPADKPVDSPEEWRTVAFLKEDPLNVFWDVQATSNRETPEMVVTEAFKQMFEKVRPMLDQIDYHWGKHWPHDIDHMANIEAFSVKGLETGGYGQALNAIKNKTGPSWRMIVELGPEVKAYGIYPGGQSGNPGSPHYDQMIEDWAKGNYYELFFMQSMEDQRQPIYKTARFSR